MSKIKANRLEPRANNGSLTIGNPDASTNFEGDVNIPGYATQEWVEGIVTDDIALELDGYQKRDEKNRPSGYAGLDADGMVPEVHVPGLTTKVSKSGDSMSGDLDMTTNDIDNVGTLKVKDITNDNGMVTEGGIMNTANANTSGWTFKDKGTDVVQLQNTGITSSVSIDMGNKRITKLPDPVNDADAATKAYVDSGGSGGDQYVKKAGDTMTGTLTLDSPLRNIDIASGTAGHLQYDGTDKMRWGTKVYMDGEIDNMGNQIRNVAGPTEDNDVANKYYVDNSSQFLKGPVRVDGDYVTSDEVIFGVYVNLTRDQAVDRGFDPETEAEGGAHSMEPEVKAGYGLFRVMGDGKLWGFNSFKGISAPPGANYDLTNMEYVDAQVSNLEARIDTQFMSLSGSTDHKMEADLYMGSHRLTGLSSEYGHASDALSYTAGDARYVTQSAFEELAAKVNNVVLDVGTSKLDINSIKTGSIDLTNGGRHINALPGDSGHLSYDDKMKVKWANNLDIHCDTNLQGNKLHSVADPESSYDAVNKRYVDSLIKRIEALEAKLKDDGK